MKFAAVVLAVFLGAACAASVEPAQREAAIWRVQDAFCQRFGGALVTSLQEGLTAEIPADVEGFVVLGGGLWAFQHGDGGSGERIAAAFKLTREYPKATLVFTGRGEAEALGALFVRDGVGAPMLLEPSAKDTYENARNTRELLGPRIKRPWAIITSAWHMKRALATFRAQGFDAWPYPVDFLDGSSKPACAKAMREVVGYIYYLFTWRM